MSAIFMVPIIVISIPMSVCTVNSSPNPDYSNPYEFQSDSESYVNSEIYENIAGTADQTIPSSRTRNDSRYANLPSVSRAQQPYANVNGECGSFTA